MPRTWEGAGAGDTGTLDHWRRLADDRRRFEQSNPELATRRDAVAAHEGVFEAQPVTFREIADRAGEGGDARIALREASKARRAGTAASAAAKDAG